MVIVSRGPSFLEVALKKVLWLSHMTWAHFCSQIDTFDVRQELSFALNVTPRLVARSPKEPDSIASMNTSALVLQMAYDSTRFNLHCYLYTIQYPTQTILLFHQVVPFQNEVTLIPKKYIFCFISTIWIVEVSWFFSRKRGIVK